MRLGPCTNAPGHSGARSVFDYLQRVHHRPCSADTPVVVHEWTNAGLGNALSTLLLSFHFGILHNRTLVTTGAYRNHQQWIWTNGTGFDPSDVYWPSSCDAFASSSASGVRVFRSPVRMRAPAACPAYSCAWANVLPSAMERMCVMSWCTRLPTLPHAATGRSHALGYTDRKRPLQPTNPCTPRPLHRCATNQLPLAPVRAPVPVGGTRRPHRVHHAALRQRCRGKLRAPGQCRAASITG